MESDRSRHGELAKPSLLPSAGSFVILHHIVPPGRDRGSHWDLMLEAGDTLRTWALDQFPVSDVAIVARALPDHRRWYLTYEGPLTPDDRGDRGTVQRVAMGQYQLLEQSLERCVIDLQGDTIMGRATICVQSASPLWTFKLVSRVG